MKKIISNINRIAIAVILLMAMGCEDYLDKEPLDGFSDESVFADKALITAYLADAYNFIPLGFGDRGTVGRSSSGNGWFHTFAHISDNCRNKSGWVVSNKVFNKGLMSPTQHPFNNWDDSYKAIRKCNNIIEGLENSPLDASIKDRLNGEARFIRAFMYFNLARRFGAVPLIKHSQTFDEDLFTVQTAQSKVYKFASDEFGAIGAILPLAKDLPDNEYGRATSEAAYAMQGRVLLFEERWAESAAASKKVIDSESGFVLSPDYGALFQTDGSEKDKEVIFEIMCDLTNKYHSWEADATSPGYGGGGQHNPTQELVDEYETVNGLSPEDDPEFDEHNPYANRDSRLAASICYHGMEYRGRLTDFSMVRDAEGNITPVGIDAPLKSGLHTQTGYYVKKFNNENEAIAAKKSNISWKEIRLGEVLLNYAEALNQANGPSDEVYEALDLVRTRAGVAALSSVRPSLNKEEMIEEILHERRVELAFENHRYWDLIRYRRAHIVLNNYLPHGMFAIKDEVTGEMTYERFEVNSLGKQVFPEKYYLMPIPQSERDKNPSLDQNYGY